MYCKNCGNEVNENAAACLKCGANPKKGNKFCASCGEPVNENQVVCLKCGSKVSSSGSISGLSSSSSGAADYGNYSKIMIAVICFFVGGVGVHNFMLGETKKGIVKIAAFLLCGLGWILALIDFIRILTDNYEIDPEKYF